MNQPEPQSIGFNALMADIERGVIKIPQFQREFVWSRKKAAKLIDSILKGYPIGTFILWKTKERLRSIRDIGGFDLPDPPPGDFVQYVLDGQQRLTSLLAAVKGLTVEREGHGEDFSELCIVLEAEDEEGLVAVGAGDRPEGHVIGVVDLMNAELKELAAFPEPFHGTLSNFKSRLSGYQFSTVQVREAPLDVATEIFTRINVTGRPLTVFEIMVAKTFDPDADFDLAEAYEELIDVLGSVGYETISPAVILQLVAVCLKGECTKKDILSLDREAFIHLWPRVTDAVLETVDYLRGYFRIPVSHLLPYRALVVPIAYFFVKRGKKPTSSQQVLLRDFFWRVSLGGRYSYALESRLAADIKKIDAILEERNPDYEWPIDARPEFVADNGWFSAGRSYCKALLCILAHQQPKSFVDNALVHISNDWLKRANSKNYHHVFPRAYLRNQRVLDPEPNHIANIAMVDDYLNKRRIGSRAPSDYFREFREVNSDFEETMASHLIDPESSSIWENQYDRFFRERCTALSREIRARIVERRVDQQVQAVQTDDLDPVALLEE